MIDYTQNKELWYLKLGCDALREMMYWNDYAMHDFRESGCTNFYNVTCSIANDINYLFDSVRAILDEPKEEVV